MISGKMLNYGSRDRLRQESAALFFGEQGIDREISWAGRLLRMLFFSGSVITQIRGGMLNGLKEGRALSGAILWGEWVKEPARDGRRYSVTVIPEGNDFDKKPLFKETTCISGTAIVEKYERSPMDPLPELELMTFSNAKKRLDSGSYEEGGEYSKLITSRGTSRGQT